MPAFTKRFVEAAEPNSCSKCEGTGQTDGARCKRCRGIGKVDAFFWRDGHGLKVTPFHARIYLSQYQRGGRGVPPRRVTIGTHGKPWTPEQAWKEHQRILGLVAAGHDPAAEKRAKREAARRQPVDDGRALEAVATRWFNYQRREGKRSADEVERSFKRHVYPELGARRIETIAKADAHALYERLADAGHASMGHQLCRNLKALLSFAVERELIDANPLLRLKLPQLESRERVLIAFHPEQEPDPTELMAVWQAADQLPEPRRTYVKVLILTLAREDEIAGMTYAEIDDGLWRLPKERHKGKRGYDIPLPTQALKLIEALPKEREVADVMVTNEFVFTGRGGRAIGDFSQLKADLDDAILKAARETDPKPKPLPHWRLHDLRRSGSSWIEEEFGGEIMHACLGHSLGNRLAKVYARGPGYRRKKRALQAWADFVTGAAAQLEGSNVVSLSGRR
jgi:integrase